ncbi:cysteine dioxygenase [Goodfellowiella coeruleoviolacea]|uniref:Metal-dependent enzyme of the double-stranded beta helix superfamily n=1 Tax=Goodfellowiella coeruleoviolacea TaxID=334858 RepID=A0AAE3GLZ1_9PSEU|nr:cysteine dioxygenase family protein [Goodfellowiella coeruleoviolacea]MCP2169932.1 putative metal-dependent enzyme of the double-stranded beta helix superfamily [Goodfellowiella coeruleoviolacea]
MFAVPANTVALPANPTAAHPVRVALDYATNRDSWRHLLRYDPDQRWSRLLDRTDDQEVWLLSWLPGQHTDLHDHGAAFGAFTVVTGTLTESVTRRRPTGEPVQLWHELRTGQSRVFGPGYVHQVHNNGVDPAVTVHVYRAAPRTLVRYRFDPLSGPRRAD